jgi:hypothetical protein
MPDVEAPRPATEPPKSITDAIATVKDTTKWIIAALGAVLSIMLGGIQLNAVGFARPDGPGLWVWLALMAVAAVVVATLWLGVHVLVSGGVALDELLTDRRFKPARDYLNQRWAYQYAGHDDVLGYVAGLHRQLAPRVAAGTLPADDPTYVKCVMRLTEATHIAGWRMTLVRFNRMVWAFRALVPVAVAAAVVMASHSAPAGDGKPLDPPQPVRLTPSLADAAVLAQAGIAAACRGPVLNLLVYQENAAGIGQAVGFPDPSCPPVRLLLLDRKSVLRVLPNG